MLTLFFRILEKAANATHERGQTSFAGSQKTFGPARPPACPCARLGSQRRGPPLWDGGAESSPGTLRGAGRKRNLPGRPTRRTRRTRPTRPTRSSSRNAATTYDIPTMSLCEVNPSERVRGTISEVRGYRVDILESISGAGIARAPAIAAAVAAMLPPRATFRLFK